MGCASSKPILDTVANNKAESSAEAGGKVSSLDGDGAQQKQACKQESSVRSTGSSQHSAVEARSTDDFATSHPPPATTAPPQQQANGQDSCDSQQQQQQQEQAQVLQQPGQRQPDRMPPEAAIIASHVAIPEALQHGGHPASALAATSGSDPLLMYDALNPYHSHFSMIENPTTAMVDVEASGHVVLHLAGTRTNFKGLKDFEDLERQEANKSIMHCFGCDPNAASHENRFNPITELLSSIFTMPIALVVFLDGDLAYIRGEKGMSQSEPTSRGLSFCTWTLVTLKPEVQVVPDTLRDGRFRTHPYVTGLPHLRFYAGAPLISTSGHRLGSLCLADYKPRTFDAECCSILCKFAEIVVRDAERFAHEQMQSVKQWAAGPMAGPMQSVTSSTANAALLRDILPGETTSVALLDTRDPGWPMLFASDGFTSTTGVKLDPDVKTPFWEAFWTPESNRTSTLSSSGPKSDQGDVYADQVRLGATFNVEVVGSGLLSDSVCVVRFTPAAMGMLDNKQVHININIPGKYVQAVEIEPSAYYFATVHRVGGGRIGSGTMSETHDPQQHVPFDDVQLGGLLGKGSFGSVYVGLCGGEAVAVKVVEHKALQSDPGGKSAREEMEATLGLTLDHPNVVRTHKFTTIQRGSLQATRKKQRLQADSLGSTSGSGISSTSRPPPMLLETWIVLSLCDQGSLQAAIDEGAYRSSGNFFQGAPHMAAILTTASEIASAMQYLHGKGILHGDLTANNILLASAGGISEREGDFQGAGGNDEEGMFDRPPVVAMVSDFGLSRACASETGMRTNTFGTVTHMPPELLRDGHLSKAVDVYAFGVLLWEMYVGERPWAGLRPVTIILKKTQGKATLLWPNGTPPAYQELADACMESEPQQRPSFPVILDRLARLTADEGHHRLEPRGDFAVYHGWQQEVAAIQSDRVSD